MEISVLNKSEQSHMSEAEIVDLLSFALLQEDQSEETEVSVLLTSDEEVHELNRDYRGIDAPTDVLSFALREHSDEALAYEDIPELDDNNLGDIILAMPLVEEQAAEYGNTPQEEMAFLLVHGLLHLLGYDHIEDDDAERMQKREKEILALFESKQA
ncbi:MAG: rRNA maturation RNase YbeY [Coriobacteriia bacterium]|nr:rRNA maturation RNase YbeY [Coriobacteriia bacterium]